MNQEQVAMRLKDFSKITGEILLKLLWAVMERTGDAFVNYTKSRKLTGEVKWNRLMGTDSNKSVKEFMASELNLDKLKDYLKDDHLAFAIERRPDGQTALLFEAKNKEMVERAFNKVIGDLAKDPEQLNNSLIKTPENMNVQDKIAHYQKKVDNQIETKRQLGQSINTPKQKLGKELER